MLSSEASVICLSQEVGGGGVSGPFFRLGPCSSSCRYSGMLRDCPVVIFIYYITEWPCLMEVFCATASVEQNIIVWFWVLGQLSALEVCFSLSETPTAPVVLVPEAPLQAFCTWGLHGWLLSLLGLLGW